jgi:pentatricopeptide repeat protein
MEDVFKRLVNDSNVSVQGTHWAALINVWGCARKDVAKTIEIFESIASHPTTRQSGRRLPDEVVFEALMNVFVTNRRSDLMDEYLQKMPTLGIRMTAYIANCLIKGYSAAGDLARARAVFESLSDPPEGIAAPGNHASHGDDADANVPVSPRDSTVYREVCSIYPVRSNCS